MTFDVGDYVVVPGKLDTGILVELNDEHHVVLLDFIESKLPLEPGELRTFQWKHRTTVGRFLVKAKAWISPFSKKRHFRIQYHVIRDNGAISGRVERIERVNGISRR